MQILQIPAQNAPVVVNVNGVVILRADGKAVIFFHIAAAHHPLKQQCAQKTLLNGVAAGKFVKNPYTAEQAGGGKPPGQFFGVWDDTAQNKLRGHSVLHGPDHVHQHLIGGVADV